MPRASSLWPVIVGAMVFMIFLVGGILLFFQGDRISGGVYLAAALMIAVVMLRGRRSEDETASGPAAASRPSVDSAAAADSAADDLTRIEGVGPKIAGLPAVAGIATFAELAAAAAEVLQRVLADAGSRFRLAHPATWPQRARRAADGRWDELDRLHDLLQGGLQADPGN